MQGPPRVICDISFIQLLLINTRLSFPIMLDDLPLTWPYSTFKISRAIPRDNGHPRSINFFNIRGICSFAIENSTYFRRTGVDCYAIRVEQCGQTCCVGHAKCWKQDHTCLNLAIRANKGTVLVNISEWFDAAIERCAANTILHFFYPTF